jgi:hypothetical protein
VTLLQREGCAFQVASLEHIPAIYANVEERPFRAARYEGVKMGFIPGGRPTVFSIRLCRLRCAEVFIQRDLKIHHLITFTVTHPRQIEMRSGKRR